MNVVEELYFARVKRYRYNRGHVTIKKGDCVFYPNGLSSLLVVNNTISWDTSKVSVSVPKKGDIIVFQTTADEDGVYISNWIPYFLFKKQGFTCRIFGIDGMLYQGLFIENMIRFYFEPKEEQRLEIQVGEKWICCQNFFSVFK